MEDKDKTNDQPNETIEAVKEEFEKKISEMQLNHTKELEALKKNHVEEIRALISGSNIKIPENKENDDSENDALNPNKIYENLKKKFKL